MVPVVLGSERLQVLLQQSSHGDDAVSHFLDLSEPLLVECWVVEDLRCYTCAMYRWVRVHWADENLDLRVNAGLLSCVLADNRESSDTLTIKTLTMSTVGIKIMRIDLPCS